MRAPQQVLINAALYLLFIFILNQKNSHQKLDYYTLPRSSVFGDKILVNDAFWNAPRILILEHFASAANFIRQPVHRNMVKIALSPATRISMDVKNDTCPKIVPALFV